MENKINILSSHEEESSDYNHLFFREEKTLLPWPKFHKSHELIYILEGKAQATISGKSFVISNGDICLINPNQVHFYNILSDNITVLVLVMGYNFSHHFRRLHPNDTFQNTMYDKEKNQKIYNLLMGWKKLEPCTPLQNCGYGNLLFDLLAQSYGFSQTIKSKEHNLSLQFIKYIEENYNRNISLEDAANYFSYSKEYFCQLFKTSVGQNFLSVLNTTRINKVMEMLASNSENKKLEEIAIECGFFNQKTFYRHYKEYLNSLNKI